MLFKYMGLFDSENLWIHPERTEPTYELIYNLKNDIYLEEDGILLTVKKGEIVILEKGVMHKGAKYSDGPVSFYWVHFTSSTGTCPFPHFSKNFDSPHLFRELMHYSLVPGANEQLKNAVLMHILTLLSYESSKTLPKVLEETLSYIQANADIELTASKVAKHFDYSPEHLSRILKKHCGYTLKMLIDEAIINSAKGFLSNTNLSVKEISYLLKFPNSNAFINFFKYHEGMSPTFFRSQFTLVSINSK